jgi:hypothetical protein
MKTRWTFNEMATAQKENGLHWFDADTMGFFGTRFESPVYTRLHGVYFVTSERPPHGRRGYAVRRFDPTTASISTVGEFMTTKAKALNLLTETTYEKGA